MNTRLLIISIVAAFAISSCSSYQKALKDDNAERRLVVAQNLYQQKKYGKAAILFESLRTSYRGSSEQEQVLFLLAECNREQKNYYSASQDYAYYVKQYPRGAFSEEARYQIGHCLYLDMPDVELDQSGTEAAYTALSDYLDLFPQGQFAAKAQEELISIDEHLALKQLRAARLYYNLGTYTGNNYRAAITTSEQAIKEHPDTKYREEFAFIMLQAKYKEAGLSVPEKRQERYSEVVDECYRYQIDYPAGKYTNQASKIMKEAKHNAEIKK